MFIGRTKELAELERAYKREGFQIFTVWGQEGSGKTVLLHEFCKDRDAIFFSAAHKNNNINLTKFSDIVLAHYRDEYTKHFMSWQNAFEYILDKQSNNRLVLVLDDFNEIVEHNAVFMNMFQNMIEQKFKSSNIFLVISTNDSKLLKTYFLDAAALLNRRVTGKIALERFVLDDTSVKLLEDNAAETEKGISNVRLKFSKVSADEVILREGEINDSMYKIISGKALCYFKHDTDNEYLLASLKEGNCFGEYSLLTGKPGIYTVTAFTDMLIMKITKEDFDSFISINPKNAIDIMHNMAGMLNVMAVNIGLILNE